MLSFRKVGDRGPLLVLLHWLGGSAATWDEVSRRLAERGVTCVAIDAPGFGASAGRAADDVADASGQIAETIRGVRARLPEPDGPWVLAGHSMGGKYASVIARKAAEGEPGLDGLRGLVMVSASPPGPEPMAKGQREETLELLGERAGDEATDRKRAGKFVDDNTGKLALPPAVREAALEPILAMRRYAFREWLEAGSKEDWAERVGVLPFPGLVIAGSEDKALGTAAQREKTLPHFAQGTLVELEGAGHLAPLERPGELVEYVTTFLAEQGLTLPVREVKVGAATAALMEGERTSPKTLAVMEQRLGSAADWNYQPVVLDAAEFRTMRALAEAVAPQAGFDVAASMDAQLAESTGDGWRFAVLPEDRKAWKQGFASLDLAARRMHGVPFVGLYAEQQRSLLEQAAEGKLGQGVLGRLHLGEGAAAFNGLQMKSWFEDVRGELARIYMADPRTMEALGYTGFADDLGWVNIQLTEGSATKETM